VPKLNGFEASGKISAALGAQFDTVVGDMRALLSENSDDVGASTATQSQQ
jgi:hypothetical protein